MLQEIFEVEYTHYDPKLKLKMLHEYLAKIPRSKTNKFMKLLHFHGTEPTVYNVKTIEVSKSIVDGTAAQDSEEKVVKIVYSDKNDVKAMTCKKFGELCKAIFKELENVNEDEVRVVCGQDGITRTGAFRFYFDDSTDFAMLVRYTNEKGVKAFIEANQEDLAKAMEVKENTKPKIVKNSSSKLPKKDLKIKIQGKHVARPRYRKEGKIIDKTNDPRKKTTQTTYKVDPEMIKTGHANDDMNDKSTPEDWHVDGSSNEDNEEKQ